MLDSKSQVRAPVESESLRARIVRRDSGNEACRQTRTDRVTIQRTPIYKDATYKGAPNFWPERGTHYLRRSPLYVGHRSSLSFYLTRCGPLHFPFPLPFSESSEIRFA